MCEDHTEIWNFMQYKDLSFIVSGWFYGIIWVVEGVLIPNQSSTVCPNGLRTTGCFFLVFMVIILIVSYYINIFVFCHWLIYFPTIRQLVYFNIAEFAIISNTAMRVCFFFVCVYTVTPLNYFLEVASWEQIYYNLIFFLMGSPDSSVVKNLPAMQEIWVQSLGWEDPLEKKMATHSSTLAWEIPGMEEPGGLQSMVSQSQTLLSD